MSTPLTADESPLICRHAPEYLAVKIHPEYDYWLYIPKTEKDKQPSQHIQLYFWDDAV